MGLSADLPDENEEQSKIYVRFIDILFAVVLGQSFSFLSSQGSITEWISSPINNITNICNVLLAYALVITSCVGYHKSTSKLPIRNVLRFIIDLDFCGLWAFGFLL